jgi:exoribonuclease R
VINLVKRTEKVLVGKYIKRPKNTYGFVQVVEGFAGKDIFVSDRDSLGAKNDEIVTIRVFGDKNKPNGKVVSIFGHKDSPGMAERIVFHENGIVKEFPKNVIMEAEKIAMKHSPHPLTPSPFGGEGGRILTPLSSEEGLHEEQYSWGRPGVR